MRYRFFTTSTTAWSGMLAAMASARESIYLGTYIFGNDTPRHDFLSLLERKAQEGVRVVIVLDAIGSFALEEKVANRLRAAGAEVRFFSHWFRRMHQKILIVDERIGFLGGVNISHSYARWSDLHVRVSGKVVAYILSSFRNIYRESGGEDPALAKKKDLPLLKKTRMWFIEHGLSGKGSAMRAHYEKHIGESTRSVVIVTPYFIPHRWLIAHLHQAILRGVSVEIIVPKHADHWFTDHASYYYLHVLSLLGANCFLSTHMNHAKVLLIDGRTGVVGSQNMDALSLDWNVESGIFFENTRMVEDLNTIVSKWRNESVRFDPRLHLPRWYDRLFAWILHFFQPIL